MLTWLGKLRKCFSVAMATFAGLFALAQLVRAGFVFFGKGSGMIDFLDEGVESLLVLFTITAGICFAMYLAEYLANSSKEREGQNAEGS
jgi:hypothetical protein